MTADLKRCFPETYRQILSLAYYLILEDLAALSRFSRWAATHEHPYGLDIPSQRCSEILKSVTEGAKMEFFRCLAKRRAHEEYWAYDSTSVSSYSEQLKQVKYGHNKDHDPLPQLNLLLLYGESSNLPFYYRKLVGNIADVKAIRALSARLRESDRVLTATRKQLTTAERIQQLSIFMPRLRWRYQILRLKTTFSFGRRRERYKQKIKAIKPLLREYKEFIKNVYYNRLILSSPSLALRQKSRVNDGEVSCLSCRKTSPCNRSIPKHRSTSSL